MRSLGAGLRSIGPVGWVAKNSDNPTTTPPLAARVNKLDTSEANQKTETKRILNLLTKTMFAYVSVQRYRSRRKATRFRF